MKTRTALAAVLLAAMLPATAFAGGTRIDADATLFVGFPPQDRDAPSSVVIVPGTVIPLGASATTPPGSLSPSAVERGRLLATTGAALQRTLRLGSVDVSFRKRLSLTVGQEEVLPPPSLTSGVRIHVKLLGAAGDADTFQVRFLEGSKVLADSKVAIPHGQRAVVGGLDGAEAPYLFLVLETAPSGEEPLAVEGDITPPRRITLTLPAYTEEARKNRIQGIVVVQAVIDKEGVVRSAQVLKGLPQGLSEAALDAVRQWRIEPARNARGEPVSVYYNFTVNFTLTEAPAKPEKEP